MVVVLWKTTIGRKGWKGRGRDERCWADVSLEKRKEQKREQSPRRYSGDGVVRRRSQLFGKKSNAGEKGGCKTIPGGKKWRGRGKRLGCGACGGKKRNAGIRHSP